MIVPRYPAGERAPTPTSGYLQVLRVSSQRLSPARLNANATSAVSGVHTAHRAHSASVDMDCDREIFIRVSNGIFTVSVYYCTQSVMSDGLLYFFILSPGRACSLHQDTGLGPVSMRRSLRLRTEKRVDPLEEACRRTSRSTHAVFVR